MNSNGSRSDSEICKTNLSLPPSLLLLFFAIYFFLLIFEWVLELGVQMVGLIITKRFGNWAKIFGDFGIRVERVETGWIWSSAEMGLVLEFGGGDGFRDQ